ncbi:hypothetical protein PV327_010109 [Microctonus hyperodae]|uniref:Uncharacterized protein n=1 Tax=Microctonus hyperodae TaxID=165561 RepID=A0AA39KUK7_MICHY|nr:hypothetical protein PV327_010109 [Microctonus hyperodae]
MGGGNTLSAHTEAQKRVIEEMEKIVVRELSRPKVKKAAPQKKKIPALMSIKVPRPPQVTCVNTPQPPSSRRLHSMATEPITSTSTDRSTANPKPTWFVHVDGIKLQGQGACWRCGEKGHRHSDSKAKVKWTFCYLCGFKGVIMDTYPQCQEVWAKVKKENPRPPK